MHLQIYGGWGHTLLGLGPTARGEAATSDELDDLGQGFVESSSGRRSMGRPAQGVYSGGFGCNVGFLLEISAPAPVAASARAATLRRVTPGATQGGFGCVDSLGSVVGQ